MGVRHNMASSEVTEVLGYSGEIVGNDSDPYVGIYDSVPVPAPNSDVLDSNSLRTFVSKPQKQKIKREIKREFDLESFSEGKIRQHGSWQQKQVSIKTLEGEFSVTMWARRSPPTRRTPTTQST